MDRQARILAVDDEGFALGLIMDALGELGEVRCEDHPQAALNVLDIYRADLVVVDVSMPDMDGYELCRRIKEHPHFKEVPVLFLSGMDSIEDKLKGYEAGGDDYLTKPIKIAELQVKAVNLLELRRQREYLQQTLKYASDAAMSAMANLGEMGVLLETLKQFNACQNHAELAKSVLMGIETFGLEGAVQLRTRAGVVNLAAMGPASPLDIAVIAHMQKMDRIVRFKSKIAVCFEGLTLLVHNMPEDDTERAGRLSDHLACLCDAAEVRLRTLDLAIEAAQRGAVIQKMIGQISQTLSTIDSAQRHSQNETTMAVNRAIEVVSDILLGLALSEVQERQMIERVRASFEGVMQVQSQEADVQNQLSGIIHELHGALGGAN